MRKAKAKAPIDQKRIWPFFFFLVSLCYCYSEWTCVCVCVFSPFLFVWPPFLFSSTLHFNWPMDTCFLSETKCKKTFDWYGGVCVCLCVREWELIKLVILHLHVAISHGADQTLAFHCLSKYTKLNCIFNIKFYSRAHFFFLLFNEHFNTKCARARIQTALAKRKRKRENKQGLQEQQMNDL